jgi:hypothetical protein
MFDQPLEEVESLPSQLFIWIQEGTVILSFIIIWCQFRKQWSHIDMFDNGFHLEMERNLGHIMLHLLALYLSVDCDTSFQDVLHSLKLSGCDVSFSMHGTQCNQYLWKKDHIVFEKVLEIFVQGPILPGNNTDEVFGEELPKLCTWYTINTPAVLLGEVR